GRRSRVGQRTFASDGDPFDPSWTLQSNASFWRVRLRDRCLPARAEVCRPGCHINPGSSSGKSDQSVTDDPTEPAADLVIIASMKKPSPSIAPVEVLRPHTPLPAYYGRAARAPQARRRW